MDHKNERRPSEIAAQTTAVDDMGISLSYEVVEWMEGPLY